MEEGTMREIRVVIEWEVTETHRLEMTGSDFREAFDVDPGILLTDHSVAAIVADKIDEMADAEDGDTWQATTDREMISAVVRA
jgi:hypothetical protein